MLFVIGGLLLLPSMLSRGETFASHSYETVRVAQGDTVWDIAARRASVREDVRDLVKTIRVLNRLDNNARIFPGQELKVPIRQNIGQTRGEQP